MRRGILRAAQYTSILLWIVWASQSGSAQAVDAADTVAESRGESHIAGKATVHVDVSQRGAEPIPRYLTGKFCEHLGNNIYNGMDAQFCAIRRSPSTRSGPVRCRPMESRRFTASAIRLWLN